MLLVKVSQNDLPFPSSQKVRQDFIRPSKLEVKVSLAVFMFM